MVYHHASSMKQFKLFSEKEGAGIQNCSLSWQRSICWPYLIDISIGTTPHSLDELIVLLWIPPHNVSTWAGQRIHNLLIHSPLPHRGEQE